MSCPECGGRGGFIGPVGWVRCSCAKPSEAARRAMQRINSIGTSGQLTLVESISRPSVAIGRSDAEMSNGRRRSWREMAARLRELNPYTQQHLRWAWSAGWHDRPLSHPSAAEAAAWRKGRAAREEADR